MGGEYKCLKWIVTDVLTQNGMEKEVESGKEKGTEKERKIEISKEEDVVGVGAGVGAVDVGAGAGVAAAVADVVDSISNEVRSELKL